MRARSRLRGSAVPSNGDPAQSSPKPVSGPRDEAGLAMIQHPGSWAPRLLPVADHPGTGSVTGHKGVYWYKSSEVSPEGCRVDSGHMLCCRVVISEPTTIRPEPSARGIIGAAWVKCCSRLPTHLAHPLENELAVVI